MPTKVDVEEFLDQKHIAFVGVSREPKAFANAVYRELRDHGRTLYPVNRGTDGGSIEGDPSYRSLAEVPDPIDGVVVMVPATQSADVVRAALDRNIPRVWLYHGVGPGSVSAEAVALCRAAGVPVVDGACPFMFDAPVHSVHRLHRALAGRRVARARPSHVS
jgi:predicted CoA-binding protein